MRRENNEVFLINFSFGNYLFSISLESVKSTCSHRFFLTRKKLKEISCKAKGYKKILT